MKLKIKPETLNKLKLFNKEMKENRDIRRNQAKEDINGSNDVMGTKGVFVFIASLFKQNGEKNPTLTPEQKELLFKIKGLQIEGKDRAKEWINSREANEAFEKAFGKHSGLAKQYVGKAVEKDHELTVKDILDFNETSAEYADIRAREEKERARLELEEELEDLEDKKTELQKNDKKDLEKSTDDIEVDEVKEVEEVTKDIKVTTKTVKQTQSLRKR